MDSGRKARSVEMVPGPGFEPGLEDSKSSVLPLDHPGAGSLNLVYGWVVGDSYAAAARSWASSSSRSSRMWGLSDDRWPRILRVPQDGFGAGVDGFGVIPARRTFIGDRGTPSS